MPVSLAFRFPAGRYHATPFGHHVNEGLIEWPPSPWRLLRALISVGYTSGLWNGTGPTSDARRLVERLAKELPRYFLPPAIGTHSRHYMPLGVLDSKRIEKTTRVFDTWARVEDREMVISWGDVCLDQAESSLLNILGERLNYLGRSESWVQCRLMANTEQTPEFNCFPAEHGKTPDRGWEEVALLAATRASDFVAWRARQLDQALADLPLPDGRKPSKTLLQKRQAAEGPFPTDLFDCLQKDTAWLRSHGWSQPPGTRRVFYLRPAGAISVGAPKAKRTMLVAERVECMLLSLTNASRNDHALPPVTRTLPQAELLHRALISVADRDAPPPSALTGRDENRRPLRGPHQHVHINPLDLDGDGHLDHILIWALGGLDAASQTAIRTVRRTFTKGAVEPLRLALAGTGRLRDLTGLRGEYGRRLQRIVGRATVWQSATPFVPPRYIKRHGKNALEGQIGAELCSRGFPKPVAIDQLAPNPGIGSTSPPGQRAAGVIETSWTRFRHFVLSRQRGPGPRVACGFVIRLEFESPVVGPVALGYGSHFGLGLFEAVPSPGISQP